MRRPAELPRRVLPAHADDADLQPRPQPVRSAADLRRCAGAPADPRHRRARRRSAGDAVRLEAVPARQHDARGARRPAASGRQADEFAIIPEIIVSAGETDAEREQADAGTRRLLAFYGSTPAYRPVLAAHGWGDLQPELNAMSKQGRWQEMGAPDRRRDAAHHRGLRHAGRDRGPHPRSRRRRLRHRLSVSAGADRAVHPGRDRRRASLQRPFASKCGG